MLLLNGNSLEPKRKLRVYELGLELSERESTADMTLMDADELAIGTWVQDDTDPGKGIVWRVRGVQQNYSEGMPRYSLEHAVNTLRDRILFGEVTPATIAGRGKTACTAEAAVRYILKQQGDWALGKFEFDVTNPYRFDGDTLFDALVTVSDSLDGAWWSYDFSRYPFRLNITRKPDGVACEMRTGRNLETLTRSVSTSGMYTRFYPIGADSLHVNGDYVSRNEDKYGVVSHVETDQSITTKAELKRWAQERLKVHAEPTVTVTARGADLSEATGEPMDRLTLGRICRIPLEEYGTVITERITELSYPDKVRQPGAVVVTMANNKVDLVKIIADSLKQNSSAAITSSAISSADHERQEKTEENLDLVAESLVGEKDGEPDWNAVSKLAEKNGINSVVTKIENGVAVMDTKITQNEKAITLEANDRRKKDTELQGKITVEADRITTEVTQRKNGEATLGARITVQADRITQEVVDRSAADNTLSGRITVEANKIALVVTETSSGGYAVNSASIVAGINSQTGSYVKIAADTINLSGYVTAGELAATNASISNLTTGATLADYLRASRLYTAAGGLTVGSYNYIAQTISWRKPDGTTGSGTFLGVGVS